MSDEDALLAAICADPADDTARLAFADLLDERGGEVEEAWARFIRAHIRLGTGTELAGDIPTVMQFTSDEWSERLTARLGLLLGVSIDSWDRGFPDSLAGPYSALRERWDELLARAPFRQLRVTSVTDDAAEDFVLWSRLDRLTALELTPGDEPAGWPPIPIGSVTERAVAALTTCPALAGLESLTVNGFPLTDRTADLVLASRHLKGLRQLRFYATGQWSAEYTRARRRLEARFGPDVCGRW